LGTAGFLVWRFVAEKYVLVMLLYTMACCSAATPSPLYRDKNVKSVFIFILEEGNAALLFIFYVFVETVFLVPRVVGLLVWLAHCQARATNRRFLIC
jgi:hypothetical protein